MKRSCKITFEISMAEILQHVTFSGMSRKEFKEACEQELAQTVTGFAEGQGDYRFDGFKKPFFDGLIRYNDGIEYLPNSPYAD